MSLGILLVHMNEKVKCLCLFCFENYNSQLALEKKKFPPFTFWHDIEKQSRIHSLKNVCNFVRFIH